MSEETKAIETTESTETTATQPETTPAAAAQQQQTVDVDEIAKAAAVKAAEVAATKMAGVYQSMLEQSGVDKDTAEKQTAAFMDSHKNVEHRLSELEKQLQEADNRNLALSKQIPDDEVDFYLNAAKTFIDDKTNLSAALDMAIEKKPVNAPNGGASFADKQPPNKSTFEKAWGE